ncbi:MAG TPA: hypothetical protein VM260_00245, partial [Pirellula sp.]|nr:hypothetical protein [Pirellula sp.]
QCRSSSSWCKPPPAAVGSTPRSNGSDQPIKIIGVSEAEVQRLLDTAIQVVCDGSANIESVLAEVPHVAVADAIDANIEIFRRKTTHVTFATDAVPRVLRQVQSISHLNDTQKILCCSLVGAGAAELVQKYKQLNLQQSNRVDSSISCDTSSEVSSEAKAKADAIVKFLSSLLSLASKHCK